MQQQPVDTAQGGFDASLHDRFAATIFTYVLNQVQNEQDAEDLLLEVFLAALSSEEKPEGTVRKTMVRTLRQLRTIYDQLEGGNYEEPI
jgi:hypothetical protein